MNGIIHIKPQGFGFVIVENGEDIFVARENLNGAFHGDRVDVRVLEKKLARRKEGVVMQVIERRLKNIVGTLMTSKTGSFIIPDDDRLADSFDIETAKDLSRYSNKKVVTKLLDCGRVELVEVLGDEHEVGCDITSIIRAHNLYEEFPKDVEKEALKVAMRPSKEEIERRLDLRKKLVLTIDPHDAKDLDDAIHLEKLESGMWELGVHIADVSHYVAENSLLDKEAFDRGTSIYFPDRVIPMLPKALSNDVCSLNPNSDRLTLSVIMTIDPNGDVVSYKVAESVININQRFSYDEVQALLDETHHSLLTTQLKKKYLPALLQMAELTNIIEKTRRKRGEVVFDVPEPKIILDETTGKIKDVVAYPHLLSHRIIETFMILCNEIVAKKMFDLEMPFIYRIHEKPDPKKVADFLGTLMPFAVEHRITPEKPSGHAYQSMLDSLDKDLKPIISQLALRSMQKAKYDPKCIGHFGLGAKYYSHFTSPIRRYPDLVIHRIIKMMINRKISTHKMTELHDFVEEASRQSSAREMAAKEVEREVDNLKKAEYMRDKIGNKFSGTISGITDFGVFVYLPENTVEGLVRLENMPNDYYTFNERQMTMIGRKHTYKMGDKLDVIVAGVNMTRRQIEFACPQE